MTKLLPEWRRILDELKLPITNLPRDVPTRWNSTFDMLNHALENRKAVDGITRDRDRGLRPYELDNDEWDMLNELREVLKVRSRTRAMWL